jgi:coenzyme F420 hydrogenase subunit beta
MANNPAGFLIAEVNNSRCLDCGLCLKVCPGKGLPDNLLDCNDAFWGNNISAYIGHANDNELWKNGQSGGIVSALLLFLLEADLIDGAVVNNFDPRKKRPSAIVARNRADIINAQGSIYAQSPVNEVALNTGERIAAVLLGCQAEGIMLSRINKVNHPSPTYIIGLICAGNYSGKMIDRLVSKSKLDKDKITSFKFRDKDEVGWPGDLSVKTSSTTYRVMRNIPGAERSEGDMEFTRIRSHYWNYRCLFCFDQMNIFSDIVVGDPWGINTTNKELGESVFIARTSKGKKIIEEAILNKIITAKSLDIETVYKGQTVDSRLKKQYFAFMSIAKDSKLSYPKHNSIRDSTELSISKSIRKQYLRKMRFLYSLQQKRTDFGVDFKMCRARMFILVKRYLAAIYRRTLGKIAK